MCESLIVFQGAEKPLPPPSESEWYHGRLDRYSAEQRLKNNNQKRLGSYLGELEPANFAFMQFQFSRTFYMHVISVRESDRKPGSYVLSYYGKTGINHFR